MINESLFIAHHRLHYRDLIHFLSTSTWGQLNNEEFSNKFPWFYFLVCLLDWWGREDNATTILNYSVDQTGELATSEREIVGRWSGHRRTLLWISALNRPTNQHHRTSSSSFHLHELEHEWPFVVRCCFLSCSPPAAFSVIHLASFHFILLCTYMHIYWVKCKTWLLWPDPIPTK